jgi:hypothetical protein
VSVASLLARLNGVRQIGAGRSWTARCPAHRDRRASLTIRELLDCRLLIRCAAGCGGADVVTAAGLEFAALYPCIEMDYSRPQSYMRPVRLRIVPRVPVSRAIRHTLASS